MSRLIPDRQRDRGTERQTSYCHPVSSIATRGISLGSFPKCRARILDCLDAKLASVVGLFVRSFVRSIVRSPKQGGEEETQHTRASLLSLVHTTGSFALDLIQGQPSRVTPLQLGHAKCKMMILSRTRSESRRRAALDRFATGHGTA